MEYKYNLRSDKSDQNNDGSDLAAHGIKSYGEKAAQNTAGQDITARRRCNKRRIGAGLPKKSDRLRSLILMVNIGYTQ